MYLYDAWLSEHAYVCMRHPQLCMIVRKRLDATWLRLQTEVSKADDELDSADVEKVEEDDASFIFKV